MLSVFIVDFEYVCVVKVFQWIRMIIWADSMGGYLFKLNNKVISQAVALESLLMTLKYIGDSPTMYYIHKIKSQVSEGFKQRNF